MGTDEALHAHADARWAALRQTELSVPWGEARAGLREVVDAIEILARGPLVGRPVRGGMRELVVGHGNRGRGTICRYLADIDTAFVLARRGTRTGFQALIRPLTAAHMSPSKAARPIIA